MKPQLRVAAGCLLACLALAASAQQPSPLDVVPDKMPNDIPYGTPISLERAQAAVGCSGGTGSQDEVVCRAGADAVKR